MSEADSSPPPFWIQPEIQEKIVWRDGDVVISVPAKSGTTWTMNIVYQLFTGGTADFRDIYEEVPWIEFVARPDQPHRDILDRLDAMPCDRRRAFKTHSAPPVVPFIPAGEGPDVKYVVVFRNPEEALVSFWPFLAKHADEWFDLWGMSPGAMSRPDFPSFYREVIAERGMHASGFFGFLNAWWPLRQAPNVLFLHYSKMKQDHAGSIRKIAKFIGVEPSEDEWKRIVEYTSFGWMKAHEDKFEATTAGEVPILQRGAMIRKGQAGDARADGMTPEISRDLRALGESICQEPAMLDWFYTGENAG
jgi:hypothetical protein